MNAILILITSIIDIYVIILIASIVLHWLIFFNVINTSNRFVYVIGEFLYKATEPVLAPIRRVLPNLGGLDLSPIVVFLALYFIRNLIVFDLAPALR